MAEIHFQSALPSEGQLSSRTEIWEGMRKEMNEISPGESQSMAVVVVSGKKRARAIQAGLCGAVLRVFGQRGLTESR